MANALAVQVSNDITKQNKKRYSSLNSKSGPKSLWSAVRQLTGTKCNMVHVKGITVDSLNTHYASVSTDSHYLQSPPRKSTCSSSTHASDLVSITGGNSL